VGTPYTYAITTADADADAGDALTITAPTKPAWLTLVDHADRTATLGGTPTVAGDYAVVLQVTDGHASASQPFNITVSAPPTPCTTPLDRVTLLGPTAGYTGTALVFQSVISPANATPPFTYTWSGSGIFENSVATYTWDATGSYPLLVAAENCGATVSDTQTIVIAARPAAAGGDIYEPDNVCPPGAVSLIPTDGTIQQHTFHAEADEDWVAFEATGGITYVVVARVPPPFVADVALELHQACGQPGEEHDPGFSPEIHLNFEAPESATYYLRLTNTPATVYGEDVNYQLSVRELQQTTPGAIVIVAGKLKDGDELQSNIHNVSDAVYQFARSHGCTDEQIYYLASDSALAGFDALATTATLESALTTWAASKVGPERPLSLFMMDHGDEDKLYLNGAQQYVTPAQLDAWLTQLETQSGADVNLVVEACHAGSFIDAAQSASGEGRVAIASTGRDALAFATQSGAVFADAFVAALRQGMTLYEAYQDAAWSTQQAHPYQTPALDDDGDHLPNGVQDGQVAMQRGFACANVLPAQESPPYIAWSEIKRLRADKGRGEIWAEVRDDREVQHVWAAVYPPSYQPATAGSELQAEPVLRLPLSPQGNDLYGAQYMAFDEIGVYRIVIFAEDTEGLPGRPQTLKVQVGWQVYLPLVWRQ